MATRAGHNRKRRARPPAGPFNEDSWRGTANITALEDLRVALRNAAHAVRPELARLR